MTSVNKYANRSKISEAKSRQFLKLFSFDLDASLIALVTGLNRNTVNRYLMALRQRIAEHCERQAPVLGEIEVDESYFEPRRVKDSESVVQAVKPLSLASSSAKAKSIPKSCLIATEPRFMWLSEVRVNVESVIHSDGWRGYKGLLDIGYQKLFRVITETMNLPMSVAISMAWKSFGGLEKSPCQVQRCQQGNLICI